MKFIVLQSNFAKALSQVSRIVSARTTLPVLSNILIEAKKGKIQLSATDLEVAITSQATGKIEEEGSITIPARLLSDYVVNNTDESIEFSCENTLLSLKSERFEATINGINSEEFPTIPSTPQESYCNIEKEKLISSLKRVLIAPANDETRPVLTGILFQFKENILTLAATDSYRLAEVKINIDQKVEDKGFIVPARTMNEAIRIMSSTDVETIMISPTENQISFKIGDTKLVSRLIEGSFPPYTQIIPSSSKIKVSANYTELMSALKMSALFAKDSANNIKVKTGKDELIIKSMASQTGSANAKVSAQIEGGEIEIAFNVRFLLDVLQVISGDIIVFEFNDPASPGLIKSAKNEDYIYIVMPLKIDD